MEDTQREPRVTDVATGGQQADEPQSREVSAVPPARLLANPRRVRRA